MLRIILNEASRKDKFPMELMCQNISEWKWIQKTIYWFYYTNRGIAWFRFLRRTWQAAISPGEPHAGFEPGISELENFPAMGCREANLRRELKHLSTGRKRKQNVIPLLAASEKGKGQTESPVERLAEMWWRPVAKSTRRSSLEWDALEGDSPVFEVDMSLSDRVGLPELEVRIWQD